MFCNKCGTVVPDDSAFCHKCGYKFVIPLVQTPTPTQTTTPQPVIYPPAAPQGAPQQPIAPAPVPQPVAVPQPQVAPQRVQYAPQPTPQPQVIPAPQPIQYAPQPQVTPAPQPAVPQAQYQQPVYQPQMTYAPVSTIAHTPKKPFNAKKSAAIVAISVPVGSLLGAFISALIVVLLGQIRAFVNYDFDSPNRIRIDNLFYFIDDIIYEIVPLIVFFLLYYIFSKGNRNKAPRFIWIVFYSAYNVFCNLLQSTLQQIFYTPNIPDKYDPDIYEKLFYISTTITLVSFLFACIMSYIIAAIILYQLYSRFDSSGHIIHNRLLLKNRLPLDKKGAMLCALCVPVTMLVNLIIGVISDKIPIVFPTGLSPVFFKTIYIGISVVFAVIFISNKKFSGFPQALKLLICAFMSRFYFKPINSYFILRLFYNVAYLSDSQLETSNVLYYIFDFPIELLCAFALMYSILKDLAAPAHKFPPELIVQKAPAITE